MSNIECKYLSELDINDKFFDSLKEDYSNFGTNQAPQNTLEKFLNVSASEYKEELIEMLKAISKESLEEIFNELEIEGICIDSSIREKYIKKFELNQKIINKKISGKRL